MNDQSASGLAAQFKPDFNKIFNEVKEVTVNPVGCWNNVRGTYTSITAYYLNFLVPLAAIPAIMGFVTSSLIGKSLPIVGTFRVGLFTGLAQAVISFVVSLAMMYLTALILGKLAAKFGGTDDLFGALKLAGYARSPAMLAAVLTIVPGLGDLAVLLVSLYTIYVFYQGISPMLSVPAEQRIIFTVVAAIVLIIASVLVGFATAILMGGAALGGGSLAGIS